MWGGKDVKTFLCQSVKHAAAWQPLAHMDPLHGVPLPPGHEVAQGQCLSQPLTTNVCQLTKQELKVMYLIIFSLRGLFHENYQLKLLKLKLKL